MATYYDQFTGLNAGAALWVGDRATAQNGVTVSWEGGWHSFAGSWSVHGIYNSIGRDAGAGELRRDYTENGSVEGSGDAWWTEYTETFPRYSYDYDVTLYSYVRASVNGATREAQAEYTFTVPHLPDAPTDLTANYVSDNRIDLTWHNPSQSYEAMCIEVSIDGGAWSEYAVIWNTSPTAYSYTAASADHIYRFRLRAYYHRGYSAYTAETAPISTAPAAPQAISTAAIQGSTNVAVTLENASGSATGIQWQFTSGDPSDESSWGASTPVPGAPVTSFTATGISGAGYIRVRNTNATGESAWIVSQRVVTICPPAAPTPRTPAGSYVDMADGSISFSWLHNPLDGSAQTAYQLRYAVNGGNWTTLSGSTASARTLAFTGLSVGDSIKWQVRTKGADPSYGPWSGERTFSLYTAPTVSIASPAGTVREMPIELEASYSDMAGFTCQSATVSLMQDGRALFTEAADISGNAISASLTTDEFLPINGQSYTVELIVTSSSGLKSSANTAFAVDFIEPPEGALQITNDPDTGYVSLLATFDNTGAEAPAQNISVSRVNADGTLTPLLTRGASGSGIVDRYAPLNTPYRYAVTTQAASKAVKTVYFDNTIESAYWFAYWGDNVAKARWNPSGGVSVTRPEKKRVHYVGRTYPVSYDSLAVDQQNSLKFTGLPDEANDRFFDLMQAGGRGVYKGADGSVFHADFEYSTSANYYSATRMEDVSLTITRIDGGQL